MLQFKNEKMFELDIDNFLNTFYNQTERKRKMSSTEPLAYRMRPKTLEEYEGQEHVIGPGKLLYRTIKADRL